MTPRQGISLSAGLQLMNLTVRDVWIGVAGLGGDLTEFEIEAYVHGLLVPDTYSHDLIAQALNEESLAGGNDHPVAYAEDNTMTDDQLAQTLGNSANVGLTDVFADIDPALLSNLDRLSRALRVPSDDLQATLDAILREACSVVHPADAAGLNLLVKGVFRPQAVVGEAPHELDLIQRSSHAGPCIDASRDQLPIVVTDMRIETRWDAFCARALELGVLSVLCVPLWVDDVRLGSLSLYSTRENAFDDQARNLANLFATHAALALADAQRVANLQVALKNRDVIGQAKGILMATHRITADEAFGRLSTASQALNIKLSRLAEAVSVTGELPTR